VIQQISARRRSQVIEAGLTTLLLTAIAILLTANWPAVNGITTSLLPLPVLTVIAGALAVPLRRDRLPALGALALFASTAILAVYAGDHAASPLALLSLVAPLVVLVLLGATTAGARSAAARAVIRTAILTVPALLLLTTATDSAGRFSAGFPQGRHTASYTLVLLVLGLWALKREPPARFDLGLMLIGVGLAIMVGVSSGLLILASYVALRYFRRSSARRTKPLSVLIVGLIGATLVAGIVVEHEGRTQEGGAQAWELEAAGSGRIANWQERITILAERDPPQLALGTGHESDLIVTDTTRCRIEWPTLRAARRTTDRAEHLQATCGRPRGWPWTRTPGCSCPRRPGAAIRGPRAW
jgi:hypothetical protein